MPTLVVETRLVFPNSLSLGILRFVDGAPSRSLADGMPCFVQKGRTGIDRDLLLLRPEVLSSYAAHLFHHFVVC